jgi:alkanesulfonate monooxygenase SsuD/methylene tetrahydromethanopterin reductase-like flavin-dependent oxidoreductase (luciferase family)
MGEAGRKDARHDSGDKGHLELLAKSDRLNFHGEFFTLNLMTPFFNPGPHDYPRIPIYIAGVNRRMCRLAGELCDGFHVHPLHTRRYLQEVICQNIQLGLTKSGRLREDMELSGSIFVIPTNNPEEAAIHESEVRQKYLSTPAPRRIGRSSSCTGGGLGSGPTPPAGGRRAVARDAPFDHR